LRDDRRSGVSQRVRAAADDAERDQRSFGDVGAAVGDRGRARDFVVVLGGPVFVPTVALEIIERVWADDGPIVCERSDAGVCADERFAGGAGGGRDAVDRVGCVLVVGVGILL
jgi:hypothetical protein